MLMFGAIVLGGCPYGTTPESDKTTSDSSTTIHTADTTDSASIALSWRELGSGELSSAGAADFDTSDCVDFGAVLLTNQADLDAWMTVLSGVSLPAVDWSIEVVVGATAACRNTGRTISILDAARVGTDVVSIDYGAFANAESLDIESTLWHAAAFNYLGASRLMVTLAEFGYTY